MNAITPALRSAALRRLRSLTIGTAIASVAATAGFGWLAAVTYRGTTDDQSKVSTQTTRVSSEDDEDYVDYENEASTDDSSSASSSSSGSRSTGTSSTTVGRSSGPAHVVSGGS